jgi:hypothetical protein
VTGTSVVASDFSGMLPTDADYTLVAAHDCAPVAPLQVRDVTLDEEQDLWVRYIAEHVVPLVPGTESERIDKCAYVTWWSLREGVFHMNNPLSYSNCSIPPDEYIGPVDVCPDPGHAWQVGISGVQAAWQTLEGVEAVALTVFPQQSLSQILIDAAATAGFGASTSLGQTIATSTDRLRISWLLRSGPVGFAAQYPAVHGQCFVNVQPWCFASGNPFAPSQAASLEVIADLTAIFEALAP